MVGEVAAGAYIGCVLDEIRRPESDGEFDDGVTALFGGTIIEILAASRYIHSMPCIGVSFAALSGLRDPIAGSDGDLCGIDRVEAVLVFEAIGDDEGADGRSFDILGMP